MKRMIAVVLVVISGVSGCVAMQGKNDESGLSAVLQNIPDDVTVELSAPEGGVLNRVAFKKLKSIVTDDAYMHVLIDEEKDGLFSKVKKTEQHPITQKSAVKMAKQSGVGAFLWVKADDVAVSGFMTRKVHYSITATIVDIHNQVLYVQTILITHKISSSKTTLLTVDKLNKLVASILINDFKRGKGLAV